MATPMPDKPRWLQAEENGQDDLAESMFASLLAEIPSVEPSAAFVDRAVHAAWQARSRRRRVTRLAYIAGAASIVVAGAVLIYELAGLATTLAARVTVAFLHVLIWFLTSASAGAAWWSIAERVGTAVGDAIASPSASASIAAFEVIALLAVYALHRLLGQELRRPGKVGEEKA
jgi:hypothetical protein